jgi:hypothetical protein
VTDHFVVHSDVALDKDNVLVQELRNVREQVVETLKLPEQRDPVDVYLFGDEASYRYYMQATWRDLPPRRAYFVGTSREWAVYSFVSPQVLEDLRHEFTHGLLHSSLKEVPLWLDEGLAEYFEVNPATPDAAHPVHLQELRAAAAEQWSPNLYRLEMASDFKSLTARDYAECWAWVHFLLHDSNESSSLLLKYMQSLQNARVPGRMLKDLETIAPNYYVDLQRHVEQLQAGQSGAASAAAF